MVGHDEHRDPIAHGAVEPIDQHIDFSLEAGRDIMNGREQDPRWLCWGHLVPNSSRAMQCE